MPVCIFLALISVAFADSHKAVGPAKEDFRNDHAVKEDVLGNLSCSSVSSPDLKNSTIKKIKFVDGKACTSEDLESPDRCDWKHQISMDEILSPVFGKQVRLAVINSSHMTGSGAWDTVLVFDCLKGHMKTIFKAQYLYGVRIGRKTDDELIFTFGEWQLKDPMCCPSKEKRDVYRWNSGENTFVLHSATTFKSEPK